MGKKKATKATKAAPRPTFAQRMHAVTNARDAAIVQREDAWRKTAALKGVLSERDRHLSRMEYDLRYAREKNEALQGALVLAHQALAAYKRAPSAASVFDEAINGAHGIADMAREMAGSKGTEYPGGYSEDGMIRKAADALASSIGAAVRKRIPILDKDGTIGALDVRS